MKPSLKLLFYLSCVVERCFGRQRHLEIPIGAAITKHKTLLQMLISLNFNNLFEVASVILNLSLYLLFCRLNRNSEKQRSYKVAAGLFSFAKKVKKKQA